MKRTVLIFASIAMLLSSFCGCAGMSDKDGMKDTVPPKATESPRPSPTPSPTPTPTPTPSPSPELSPSPEGGILDGGVIEDIMDGKESPAPKESGDKTKGSEGRTKGLA